MHTFYDTLASWWPLIFPLEDYRSENAEVIRLIESRASAARTMLALGSGGGHSAFYLRQRCEMTLTDLIGSMLEQSKQIRRVFVARRSGR